MALKQESKEQRFRRIASRRVKEILRTLRLLGNCANSAVYAYSDSDKKKMFNAIDEEIKRVKGLYERTKKNKDEFSL